MTELEMGQPQTPIVSPAWKMIHLLGPQEQQER